MKKVLFIALILGMAFVSCKKDPETKLPTTYTITNSFSGGDFYEVIVFEYMGSDIIQQVEVGNLASGQTSATFTANTNSDKIKVSMENYQGTRFYTSQKYLLTEGQNTAVVINDNTMISQNPN